MPEPRMILIWKVEKVGEYSKKWWEENIGETKIKPTIGFEYKKRGVKVLDIKSVIEIPGNVKDCTVLFHDGEEITVNGTFAEVYEAWIDAEDAFFDDDENYPSYD